MRCRTILKHDVFASELVNQVRDSYVSIEQNRSFFSERKRMIAEVDVIGHTHDSIDVYEVKCGYRISKARKQLLKIKKILSRITSKKINLFFYHGGSGELIQIV